MLDRPPPRRAWFAMKLCRCSTRPSSSPSAPAAVRPLVVESVAGGQTKRQMAEGDVHRVPPQARSLRCTRRGDARAALSSVGAVIAAIATFGGMPTLQPLVGLIVIIGARIRAFDEPPRHRPAAPSPGVCRFRCCLRPARPEDHGRAAALPDARCGNQSAARLRVRRIEHGVRAARRQGSLAADHDAGARRGRCALLGHLRVSGAADHHLHRRAVRRPLLLRRHADRRARVRDRHAARDASVRRRVAQRRRQHLHGSDRGAARRSVPTCRG